MFLYVPNRNKGLKVATNTIISAFEYKVCHESARKLLNKNYGSSSTSIYLCVLFEIFIRQTVTYLLSSIT